MHYLPHPFQVVNEVVALLIRERDDAVDGRVPLEQRSNLLIQHKMNLRLRKIVAQCVEQRRGENRIAHLTKSYDKYIHGDKGKEKLTVDS